MLDIIGQIELDPNNTWLDMDMIKKLVCDFFYLCWEKFCGNFMPKSLYKNSIMNIYKDILHNA